MWAVVFRDGKEVDKPEILQQVQSGRKRLEKFKLLSPARSLL